MFPCGDFQSFIDVGCAQGAFTAQVALAHPHLTGGGFDLPQVGPIFDEYMASHALSGRMQFHPGSFFEGPLPEADVIVYESLIDNERRENVDGLLMSLNMLIETPGGFDLTGADCEGWMREAGFSSTRVVHLQGPDSMVIGTK